MPSLRILPVAAMATASTATLAFNDSLSNTTGGPARIAWTFRLIVADVASANHNDVKPNSAQVGYVNADNLPQVLSTNPVSIASSNRPDRRNRSIPKVRDPVTQSSTRSRSTMRRPRLCLPTMCSFRIALPRRSTTSQALGTGQHSAGCRQHRPLHRMPIRHCSHSSRSSIRR